MENKLIMSIIVPIYNGERYLQRCIDSIKVQSNKNWELILIDDGSRDGTASICEKNVEGDQRIQYYYQENQGVSVARNNGVLKATGNIIVFVDADDVISDKLVETIIANWDTDMDVMLFDYYRTENNNRELKKIIIKKGECTSDDLILSTCFVYEDEASQNQNNGGVLGKAFRRGLLLENKLFFRKEMFLCEDRVFNLECYRNSKKCYNLAVPLYEYCINESSVTSKTNKGNREYAERIIENFEEYRKIILPILLERQEKNELYLKAIYCEYIYILKLILWISESVEEGLKDELWSYANRIVKLLKETKKVSNTKIQDDMLVWLCDKRMYRIIQIIIRLRKN